MKYFFLMAFGLIFSQKGLAQDWQIQITSFAPVISGQTRLAELCGYIAGDATKYYDARVVVITDPNSQNPGLYPVNVSPAQGIFCTLVNTYTGQATAELYLKAEPSAKAVAKHERVLDSTGVRKLNE